jgi:hypothetical protein
MFNRHADPLYEEVPEEVIDALIAYGRDRKDPESIFLFYCLANDFCNAVCSYSGKKSLVLRGIAKFIFNELPSMCWGSETAVRRWRGDRGY